MLVIFLTFNAVYWLFFLIRFTIHFPFPEGDQSYLCYQLDISPRSKTAQYSQSSTFQVLCIFPTLRPVSGAREREGERDGGSARCVGDCASGFADAQIGVFVIGHLRRCMSASKVACF